MGDPLIRPVEKVALEVHRKLITFEGARIAYGTVVNDDFTVNEAETEILRTQMRMERSQLSESSIYDCGGSLGQLRETCLQETGLDAPLPQWESEIYGPHAGLAYVQDWFTGMRSRKGWELD